MPRARVPWSRACVALVLASCGACTPRPVGGGPPDPAEASVRLTVDFTSTRFPPLLRKLGYNAEWSEEDPADQDAAAAAITANAPMFAGLIETRRTSLEGSLSSTMSVGGPARLPVLYRDGGSVLQARLDENLLALRAPLKRPGMVNLLQLAGTPEPFVADPAATLPPGGNWYPLPVESDFPALGQAFGRLAEVVAADGVPTVFALWQEPDHTISGSLNRRPSLRKYLRFFRQAASSIRAQDRDAVIAAAQQNSAAGLNGSGVVDGADYRTFVEEFLAEEAAAGPLPLDVVTLQNYQGERSSEILANARIAYASDRFNLAPLVMNEFDYRKNGAAPGGGPPTFDDTYDTLEGLPVFLDLVSELLDQPDLDGVMLMRNLASRTVLASWPLRALGTMSELRRVVDVSGAGAADVSAIASGDAATAGVIAWNRGAQDQTVDLDLRALAPDLVGRELTVEVLAAAAPAPVQTVVTTADSTVVRGVLVPAHAVLFARAAPLGAQVPGYVQARWARALVWCDRTPTGEAPTGQGHADPRTGSLVVGVRDATGVGLAALVLKDVSAAAAYAPTLTLSMSGVTTDAVVRVRVDYLDGDATLATSEVADPRYVAAAPWTALSGWPNAQGVVGTTRPATLEDGAVVTLPIGVDAPAGWSTADGGRRRIRLSVLLAGSHTPAVVRATLRD